MFRIEYKISKQSYNNFIGEKGYYQMICNNKVYGDIFPDNLESIMGTEYLYDWFEDMIQVAIELNNRNYIALSNIESHNLWIEFVKKDEQIHIGLVKSEKKDGIGFIVYELKNKSYEKVQWKDEIVSYSELISELIYKCSCYLDEIESLNYGVNRIKKIKELQILKSELEKIKTSYS